MARTCSQVLDATARRGALCLTEEGRADIAAFVFRQQRPDGGFRGRSDASDLYYTHFAVQALLALGEPLPAAALAAYLHERRPPGGAELVHLACLACSAARVRPEARPDGEILRRIGLFRAADGGFREKPDAGSSSAYASFLAVLAHEAQGAALPDTGALLASVQAMAPTVTPAAAARAMVLACFDAPPDPAAAGLLAGRAARKGGFRAAALAPIPDLLSTATALCALSAVGQPLDVFREPCTEFVEGLWHESGGFCGHWVDRTPDCEYTYYALLALGALANDDDGKERDG